MAATNSKAEDDGAVNGSADTSLIDRAGVSNSLGLGESSEAAWIEVIHKMDAVYADLVHYQVELEQKNSALEEAQQFISSVLGAMTDVLIVCDTQGRIQQVNKALEVLTGRSGSELSQHPISDLFGSDSLEIVDQFPEKMGTESIVDCEVSLIDREGQPTPLAMNCSSRFDHDGRLLGMVIIGRPVGELRRAYSDLHQTHNELKRTQQQLVHSEKMASLGRLVAGVAHELNNPISFVFGNIHALKRYGNRIECYLSALDSEPQSEAIRRLHKELKIDRVLADMAPLIEGTMEGAERVSDIVQDLRRYSSIQEQHQASFDLTELINTAVQWVVNASRIKPSIDFHPSGEINWWGHRGKIHQILVNLLQNAVDVMEQQPQGRIDIRCELTEECIRILVRDRGGGIAEENLDKVFDPFFTTKPVGRGTGLGLYISYGLANDMGGELQVRNHPKGGAEFTLMLPVRRPHE